MKSVSLPVLLLLVSFGGSLTDPSGNAAGFFMLSESSELYLPFALLKLLLFASLRRNSTFFLVPTRCPRPNVLKEDVVGP